MQRVSQGTQWKDARLTVSCNVLSRYNWLDRTNRRLEACHPAGLQLSTQGDPVWTYANICAWGAEIGF
jgi:hypothetical protein